MAYSIANLANVKSKKCGHILNVVSSDALENGFIVFAGDNVTGESELRSAVKPATAKLTTDSAYLVYSDEILYDESTYKKKQLGAFNIAANTPTKAYELNVNDEIEISYDGLTLLSTDAVVGNYVIAANNSYKMTESETLTGAEVFAGVITAIKTVGTLQYVGSDGQVGNQYKMVTIRIIKN